MDFFHGIGGGGYLPSPLCGILVCILGNLGHKDVTGVTGVTRGYEWLQVVRVGYGW